MQMVLAPVVDRALVDAAETLRRRNRDHVIATAVAISGGACCRLGARVIVAQVPDLVQRAWWRTEGGPCVVTYDAVLDDPDDDPLRAWLELGRTGAVDILLERAGTDSPLRVLARAVRDQRRFALATVFDATPGGIPLATHVAFDTEGEVVGDTEPALARALRGQAVRAIETGTTRVVNVSVHGAPLQVLVEAVIPPARPFVTGRHDHGTGLRM